MLKDAKSSKKSKMGDFFCKGLQKVISSSYVPILGHLQEIQGDAEWWSKAGVKMS